jgi:hypothetical protein
MKPPNPEEVRVYHCPANHLAQANLVLNLRLVKLHFIVHPYEANRLIPCLQHLQRNLHSISINHPVRQCNRLSTSLRARASGDRRRWAYSLRYPLPPSHLSLYKTVKRHLVPVAGRRPANQRHLRLSSAETPVNLYFPPKLLHDNLLLRRLLRLYSYSHLHPSISRPHCTRHLP